MQLATLFTTALLICSALSATSAQAWETERFGTVKPYLGAGMQMTHLSSRDEGTNKLFKGNVPGTNFIAGLKFGEYWGIELGLSRQRTKKRAYTFTGDEIIPGYGHFESDSISTTSQFKMYSLDVYLSRYFSIYNHTIAFLNVGFSRTVITGNIFLNTAYYPEPEPLNLLYDFIRRTKILPILSVGIEQRISSNIALRISGEWKQLNKFPLMTRLHSIALKNITSFKLGFSYKF
jgi:opacity protein-like surface antigen